jgi:hypothetical protein
MTVVAATVSDYTPPEIQSSNCSRRDDRSLLYRVLAMTNLKKALLPYGTTSSSPPIVLPDTALFLSERGSLTKNYFENAVELLNREYQAIRSLAALNELVYNASYNFVPRVGQTYHLYKKTDGCYLLSMIESWTAYEFVVSVEYTADSVWKDISVR